MSTNLALFTDGSLDPRQRIGIGAALLVPMDYLAGEAKRIEAKDVAARVLSERFENTSSTKLEVETVLWSLSKFGQKDEPMTLYTDSQCLVGLAARRSRLEAGSYLSGRTGQPINHATLYREYFRLADRLNFRVQKVSGHSDFRYQDTVHRVFHYVDREARRRLKQWLRELVH